MVKFEGEVKSRGLKDSLVSAENTGPAGGVKLEMRFKVEAGQKAKDERGKDVDVSGKELTAFLTVTENTRERAIESLVNCGVRRAVAVQYIECAEQGEYGKFPEKGGFGSKVCSLTCEMDEYKGKKRTRVQWINAEGGRASKHANAKTVELDLNATDDDDEDNSNGRDSDAPWEE